jgi:hypothetical protein
LKAKGGEIKKNTEGGSSEILGLLRGNVKYKARDVSGTVHLSY